MRFPRAASGARYWTVKSAGRFADVRVGRPVGPQGDRLWTMPSKGATGTQPMIVNYAVLRQVIAHAPKPGPHAPPDYERDAVCLLLADRTDTRLWAIQKADSEGYHWRDQVALPGGRIDPTDADATDAALRELHEELGIERSAVEVLGELGHFQTATSKNDLEVIVGHWTRPAEVQADSREVARVLQIPLIQLIELHEARGFRSRPVPLIGDALVYAVADADIWGVTARILHHFLELLLDHGAHIITPCVT